MFKCFQNFERKKKYYSELIVNLFLLIKYNNKYDIGYVEISLDICNITCLEITNPPNNNNV